MSERVLIVGAGAAGLAAAHGLREAGRTVTVLEAADLVASRFVDWGADPWSKTGYSFVPPGGVGLRDALAAPVGDALDVAGELRALL